MTIVSDAFMETPDILALVVYDDPITPGNIFTNSSAYTDAYDTWVQKTNPRSGSLEYCAVIGADKKSIRFSDLAPTTYVDRIAIADKTKYSITGGAGLTVTGAYLRVEFPGQGQFQTPSQTLAVSARITVYLQLSSPPVQGQAYTVHHSSGAFSDYAFTYNDKATRAGAIRASMSGHRPGDCFKYAYLCSRIPGAPNHGAIDFAGTYGINSFQIIDGNGFTWFNGTPTLRRAWSDLEVSDGYSVGLDLADLSQSWTITSLTKGNPTTLGFSGGHGFSNGDKLRCRGMSGATQLEGTGTTSLWIAPVVTVVDANTITIPIDSTAFGSLTTGTYDAALGGVENQAYKCFTTNRAGTNVWGLDFSAFNPSKFGTYYIYIPGFGVSDPITFDDAAHATAGALHHKGWYSLRLGMATSKSSYQRGIALKDGVGGNNNYWSTMPAQASSEFSGSGGKFTTTAQAGMGAYLVSISGKGTPWGTSTQAVGSRPGHQDAGDNDDILSDHIGAINFILAVLKDLPAGSRSLPFQPELSTAVLDATLFAGTDNMPPVFHEIAWYLEAYRTMQRGDGSVPGGYGVGHFTAQIPNYPEPLDYYRGTDANNGTPQSGGQNVGAFLYESDHVSAFGYAQACAQFAVLCNQYGLTTLANTYQASGIAAYNWANGLLTNRATLDAHYIGVCNVITQLSWSQTTYETNIATLNGRATTAKIQACMALYRLLGNVSGQTPYGDVVDSFYVNATPAVSNGGTNYAVNDLIYINGTEPLILRVATLSGSAVATVAIVYQGSFSAAPTNPVAQSSTTGSGTGATFNLGTANVWSSAPNSFGSWDYLSTSGAKTTPSNYMKAHGKDGTTTTFYNSDQICFRGMGVASGSTSGGVNPISADQIIRAHMLDVLASGVSANKNSQYLTAMMGHLHFVHGANITGKAFTKGMGPRHQTIVLHEDTYKAGQPAPDGITPYGYFAWATGLIFNNFSNGPTCDGAANYCSNNVTGSNETPPNFGSKKMWKPWIFGSSYWEWAPENIGLVFQSEYTFEQHMIPLLCMALYLHGWDGNNASVAKPGFIASGHLL